MNLVKIVLVFRKVYSNWLSVLNRMYRTRKAKDKTNEMIKVRLKGTDDILNLPYTLVSRYPLLKSISNPRIKNISIDSNLISFSYNDYNLKFDIGNGGDLYATFFVLV